jgi:hypothetical protein
LDEFIMSLMVATFVFDEFSNAAPLATACTTPNARPQQPHAGCFYPDAKLRLPVRLSRPLPI